MQVIEIRVDKNNPLVYNNNCKEIEVDRMNKMYLIGISYPVFTQFGLMPKFESRAICSSKEKAEEIKKQLEQEKFIVLDPTIIIQEVQSDKYYTQDMLDSD